MWLTTPKQRLSADRHIRLARLVLWKLRNSGFDGAKLFDIRDKTGTRLNPVNLVCGDKAVLCRPIGWKASRPSQDADAIDAGAYVQLGALDVTGLLQWLDMPVIHRPFTEVPKE
jgi:hypothetical protein